MKIETRQFKRGDIVIRTNIVLITEDQDDCDLLDSLSGTNSPNVLDDGVVYTGEYRTKLADGYGEYYLLIEGKLKD